MDNQQLWQAVLGELELMLSKANFVTWFKNTFIITYAGDQVIVGVPNTFTKAWFEKKYHSVILKALQKISENKIRKVLYRVETSKIPAEKQPFSQKIHGSGSMSAVIEKTEIKTPAWTEKEEDGQNISEIGLNSKYNFESFVIGKANQLAHAATIAAANQPGKVYNPLFIYGGVGLGKTHLLQAVGNHLIRQNSGTKVLYVSCEKFTNDYVRSISTNLTNKFKNTYRSVDVLLIDDVQFLSGKEGTQEEFFHTFNALHQNNKQIVLSSDRPPKAISDLESRLVSRFEWGMIVDVSKPDLETRIAILKNKCQEKGFGLNEEIIEHLAQNIQNNIRELEGALNRLIAYSQLNNENPTFEAVKKILESISGASTQKKSITPKHIINTVSSFYDIEIEDIMGSCRKKNLALPRQIIMFLMREETKTSYPTIGQQIGNRDHTTAMHAYGKIQKHLQEDEKLQQDIIQIKQKLYT